MNCTNSTVQIVFFYKKTVNIAEKPEKNPSIRFSWENRETRKNRRKVRVSLVEFPKTEGTESVHMHSMTFFQNKSEESLEKNRIDIFSILK
jgi:hypothetical protein